MFETKLLVIAGQSEPNEFVCSPVTLIDAERWTTGTAQGCRGLKAKPEAASCLPHQRGEYFSVWL